MNIPWNTPLTKQPRLILEDAGYHEFVDPRTYKVSYVMRVGQAFYPRYHVYINVEAEASGEFSLHVDQKHTSYEGQTAHAGEYNGSLVSEEAARLQRWLVYYTQR
ncbi:MAG TPA: hypothetical protein VJB65_01500 [Patescibacteria group bacterium]|nr:hypothetical protein [Patescibacteria group bacterium]